MKINLCNQLKDSDQQRFFQELKLDPGNKEIRNVLVKHNLRLVRWMAEKYHKYLSDKFEMDDLFQQGVIGLITAIDKYDPTEGSFGSYAVYWIKQSIFRNLDDTGSLIRIPVHYSQLIREYSKVMEDLTRELERKPTVEEIAKMMKIDAKKVEEIQIVSREITSLDIPVGIEEADGLTLMDMIEDEESHFEDKVCGRIFIDQFLNYSRMKLDAEQYEVIRMNLGLNCKEHSLKEISDRLNKTPSEINRIKQKGLYLIRRSKFMSDMRRQVDELTSWIGAVDYSKPRTMSSSRASPVERLVLEREQIMKKLLRENDELKSKKRRLE